jgi:hypothetical protein
VGVIFIIIYFIIRVNTSISGLIGATGNQFPNYKIAFGTNLFTNFGLLVGCASTAIDSVAYFGYPRRMSLVILTVALSLPFIYFTFKQLYNKVVILKQWRLILLLFIFSIIVISPHLVMGRCGELHAYSIALPYTILLVVLFDGIKTSISLYFALILFGISMIIADAHKVYGSFMNGSYGLKIIEEIDGKSKSNPVNVRIINITYANLPRPYSSFYQHEKMPLNLTQIKTHFQNKIQIFNTIRLPDTTPQLNDKIDSIINVSVKENFNEVWIIDGTSVKVTDLHTR